MRRLRKQFFITIYGTRLHICFDKNQTTITIFEEEQTEYFKPLFGDIDVKQDIIYNYLYQEGFLMEKFPGPVHIVYSKENTD